jgi:hypothetical protein
MRKRRDSFGALVAPDALATSAGAETTAVMMKSSSSLIMRFSNHELRRLTMRAVVARVFAQKVFTAKFLAGAVLAGTALGAALVTSAVAAPAPAKPAATKLSPTDIQSTFFDGKPFTATTPSNLKFKMTFTADGKMKRQPIGTGSRGEGTWKLSKDGFCTMWKGGREGCFTVVNAGDAKWSVLKGSTIMATWSK